MIAYDLETTRIAEGTPAPLYFTAYGADCFVSAETRSLDALRLLLEERVLTLERSGARYVAWNGNGYDVYFIGAALLRSDKYILRPYLTAGKNLRGLKVTLKPKHIPKGALSKHRNEVKRVEWEFLDGISMTLGNAAMTLKKFLGMFAPEFGKLEGPDFEREEFDPCNEKHRRYAERDSEGLYHAMAKVADIVREHFEVEMQPTIGNTAIRILQANLPQSVSVWPPSLKLSDIIRRQVMRGGFCHCQRAYSGPVWKYDLNQAYAAAMRDAWLPSGRCFHVRTESKFANAAIYRVRATHRGTVVPFYYIDDDGVSQFSDRAITGTWIVASELRQLKREGWRVEVSEGYAWEESFRLKSYVDRLERLRMTAEGGPSGPLGTVVKQIGNNSYGKTVEMLDGIEYVLALDRPEGFDEYRADDDVLANVWFRFCEPQSREYHQPQLGAFITAHVRMEVRRAALLAPESFLYADTDCVIYDRPIDLPIDAKRYGFWKIEDEGAGYWIITKKVYAKHSGEIRRAKGMTVKTLTTDHFAAWYAGAAPRQRQLQRQSWVKVMQGADMFRTREKVGQKMLAQSRAV